MAQVGLFICVLALLIFCLCVGSAQWVAADLLLPWELLAVSGLLMALFLTALAAGSLPAVSSTLPAGNLLPSLTCSPRPFLPPSPSKFLGVAVGRLPITLLMGQKYLQWMWRSSSSLSTPALLLCSLSSMSFYVFFSAFSFLWHCFHLHTFPTFGAPLLSFCKWAPSCRICTVAFGSFCSTKCWLMRLLRCLARTDHAPPYEG